MSQGWSAAAVAAPATAEGGGGNSLTRIVLINIAGNRATWQHLGGHGGVWQVNPTRANAIFGCEAVADEQRLSRAIIHNITLLESSTNIDEVVGVHIEGLPAREFTQNGEGASVFLLGAGRTTQPQEIFNMSGNTELGLAWMRKYPKYTSSNLDTEGVILLRGSSFYFVDTGHPAVHMLKANEDQLGVQLVLDNTIEGSNWYKVDVDTFSYCIKQIRENVLQDMMSTFDLSKLTVRLQKPDGQKWVTICPALLDAMIPDAVRDGNDVEALAAARTAAAAHYFGQPLYVTMRLRIEYTLPTTEPPPPAKQA